MSDIDVDVALADRRETIQVALEQQRQATTPSVSIYSIAHRSLGETNHCLGVALFAAAESCAPDPTEYEQWTSAALAVEYLAAFVRTHGSIIRPDEREDDNSQLEDSCGLSKRILFGDLLYTRATELLLDAEAPNETLEECLQILVTAGQQICESQALWLKLTRQAEVQTEDYLRFVERDIGALWTASAKLGGVLAEATEKQVSHLASFGRNVGVAIQLYNDVDQQIQRFAERDTGQNTDSALSTRQDDHPGNDQIPFWRQCRNREVEWNGKIPICASSIRTHIPLRNVDVNDLRKRADQQLTNAITHLDAIPDSMGRNLLNGIVERIRSNNSSARGIE